jgi:AcrR family transcriptional regulator
MCIQYTIVVLKMTQRVKRTHKYNSERRREQANATRRDIIDAAKGLFEKSGYTATSMADVAREAGVALKTVYLSFENKSGLLSALWDVLLRGGEDAPPVAQLAWYKEVLEDPDPGRQLRLNARNSVIVKQRLGVLMGVIRDAAPAEPAIDALWRQIQVSFYQNQRVIVTSIAAKNALRAELDIERAADILWMLNHPDIWLLLVGQRGWSPQDYEQWFGDTACAQLLARA